MDLVPRMVHDINHLWETDRQHGYNVIFGSIWKNAHSKIRNMLMNHGILAYQWIGLGEIYRKPPYLMVKTMVSCKFSLKPIQWSLLFKHVTTYISIVSVKNSRAIIFNNPPNLAKNICRLATGIKKVGFCLPKQGSLRIYIYIRTQSGPLLFSAARPKFSK